MLSITAFTTCFSSSERRAVASNYNRRSSSGASLVLIENERIRADGQSDRELAQHIERG
jgi:hypothetical protein